MRSALAFISASFSVPAMSILFYIYFSHWATIWIIVCTGLIFSPLLVNCSCVSSGCYYGACHLGCLVTSCLAFLKMLGHPLVLTKNLNNLSLILCLIVTLHIPNYIIFVLWHVQNTTYLSLCFAHHSIVALGNNTLNISRGIKLQSLPVIFTVDFCSLFFVCY